MAKKTTTAIDDDFDFGFSIVNEEELPKESEEALSRRLDKLYNAIQPLLNNLEANPEKEYIHWPNRIESIEKFREKLRTIYSEG